MLLPTILAEDCPHFLRAVGVLPVATLFPAMGLERVRSWFVQRGRTRQSWVLVAGVLTIATVWGLYDYGRHVRSPQVAYAFEADQVREVIEINRFLGTGWQGAGIREPRATPVPGRHVYLAPRMWEDRHTVNLLVGSPERTSILGRDAPQSGVSETLVLAWPFEDNRHVGLALPRPAEVRAWPGPLEQGDLDAEARLLYVAFSGSRLADALPAAARFEKGLELLTWEVEPVQEGQTRVRLRWRAVEPLSMDYNVFVHLVRDGQIVGQDDGTPGSGLYPTSWWRPGDEIVDEHVVLGSYDPQQDRILVGWYEWSSMRHLRIVWRDQGELEQDRLTLR
jgi:hypothetical protein